MVTDTERTNRLEVQLNTEGRRSKLKLHEALINIYDWWDDEDPAHLTKYEKELYPDGNAAEGA